MFSNPEKPDWMEKSYINLSFRDNVLDHFDLFLHKQKRRSKLIFTIILQDDNFSFSFFLF